MSARGLHVAGLPWLPPRPPTPWQSLRLMAVLVVASVAVLTVVLSATAWSIHTFDTRWTEGRADAAIVLGASAYHTNPSPVFRERIEHAIDLYKQGRVNKVIFTGGVAQGSAYSEAEVARNYAVKQGVPPSAILIEEASLNTLGNLTQAQRVAAREELDSFVVVSDAPHLMRAIAIAEDLGMDARPSATPTSRYQSWQARMGFVLRETWQYLGYKALR